MHPPTYAPILPFNPLFNGRTEDAQTAENCVQNCHLGTQAVGSKRRGGGSPRIPRGALGASGPLPPPILRLPNPKNHSICYEIPLSSWKLPPKAHGTTAM